MHPVEVNYTLANARVGTYRKLLEKITSLTVVHSKLILYFTLKNQYIIKLY